MFFKIAFRLCSIVLLSFVGIGSAQAVKDLASIAVRDQRSEISFKADGVVEAVRNTVISSQVSGTIMQLPVKAGDVVQAGQLLVRLDARAALQASIAGRAQVDAARATMLVAEKDYERQKILFDKKYISQAQLERAQAQFKSANALANAQIAQADVVHTQAGFYTLNAPYTGIISSMPSAVGETAIPGAPIMNLYDPRALRVIVTLPQAHANRLSKLESLAGLVLEFPSLPVPQRLVQARTMRILPVVDASTHTVQVRFDLPAELAGVSPGLFARLAVTLPPETSRGATSTDRLFVPRTALFRRAEVFAVYVLNAHGKPLLRLVRPGQLQGTEQEILSGVSKGELVALDPLAAAQSLVQR